MRSRRRRRAQKKLEAIAEAYRRLPWMVGDTILELEDRIGETLYGVMASKLRMSEYQLYDFARMSRLWPKKDRVFDLPWSYYRDAGSDLEIARAALRSTVKMGWSRDQLRECIKRVRKMEENNDL